MTIEQKQWQRYYMGYYTGNIDGIRGDSGTITATEVTT